MFVECNPSTLQAAGATTEELTRRLEEAGLRVMVIDEEKRRLRPFEDDIPLGSYVSLCCVGLRAKTFGE